ncbi:hypothetical protein [Roseofilum sp. Guam]|uniref:hypothetical protein n=1 Tax=Roseofilum sp. Guam TaxID=2821502 RepID=UPI001B113AA6|nr:hypothetical protein [Roseofilum sp. Guam]MBP0029145.1 hypothetical protein [Roseofilum sp. Guam]
MVQALCNIANGLGTKEVSQKDLIPKKPILSRVQAAHHKLNIHAEDFSGGVKTYSRRVVAVLKAVRIGLIIFDYDTCQYVPNPDFKQPEGDFLIRDSRKEDWDKKSLTDEQISRAKELLISGELCRTKIIAQVLKMGKGKKYPAGKKKLLELEAELEAQGYKCPKISQAKKKHLQKLNSSRENSNHPWRVANSAFLEKRKLHAYSPARTEK